MHIDNDIIRIVTQLKSDDNKMLLLNNRYYCELTESSNSRVVESKCCVFSESLKEENSPTFTQYANCFVLDAFLGKGHHTYQFGKLYHFQHVDLTSDAFSLMLNNDKALINVISIEVVNKPYPIKKFIDMLDKDVLPKEYESGDGDPMLSLDGVAFVDFGKFGSKSASMEYDIHGQLYFEIVDFKDVPSMGIVHINDTSRREVLVNMPCNSEVLNDDNAKRIASLISTRLKELKQEV